MTGVVSVSGDRHMHRDLASVVRQMACDLAITWRKYLPSVHRRLCGRKPIAEMVFAHLGEDAVPPVHITLHGQTDSLNSAQSISDIVSGLLEAQR